MAHRAEVFRSKVLHKLYPAVPELKKQHSPPHTIDTVDKKKSLKRNTFRVTTAGDAGKMPSETNLGKRRLYTVLPPPPDYKTDSEKSVTLCQKESINSAEDPAESGRTGPNPVTESSTRQSQTTVDEEGKRMNRNKKRKLKKKRHKEKLHSMGLMPRAAPLEFTYQREEEEREDWEARGAEVADFLRTTMEIYMSDSSSCAHMPPFQSVTVDDLLSSIASVAEPTSVLKQLYSLKVLVQQKEIEKLEKALDELQATSSLSAEETTAVVSLFQYWITAIIPMQGDKKTGLSTPHP